MQPAEHILVLPARLAFPPERVEQALRSSPVRFEPSGVSGDLEAGEARTCEVLYLHDAALLDPVFDELVTAIDAVLLDALPDVLTCLGLGPVVQEEQYALLRYQVGQHYSVHVDQDPAGRRALSVLLYLNANYAGGGLRFPDLDVEYTPSAGDLVCFPSGPAWRHQALPVLAGTKYAIATWFHHAHR